MKNHVKLEIKNYSGSGFFKAGIVRQVSTCKPFVKNDKGVLIHRPISIDIHKVRGRYHMAIHYACGLTSCGSKKFTFLDAVRGENIVCFKCEMMAVEKYGYKSSSEISGRHVHTGGVRAYKNCGCGHEQN